MRFKLGEMSSGVRGQKHGNRSGGQKKRRNREYRLWGGGVRTKAEYWRNMSGLLWLRGAGGWGGGGEEGKCGGGGRKSHDEGGTKLRLTKLRSLL